MLKENNYAFIDAQNLYMGVKKQGWELDYTRLRVHLSDKYRVSKAFLFMGYIKKYRKKYKELEAAGFIIIFKEVTYRRGVIKGNVDAELVLHAATKLEEYDKAVIITGDGDFACLIEYLLEKGKLKRLIFPNRNLTSYLLLRNKRLVTFLDEHKSQLKKDGRRRLKPRKL